LKSASVSMRSWTRAITSGEMLGFRLQAVSGTEQISNRIATRRASTGVHEFSSV
jgi:hypothetical protein